MRLTSLEISGFKSFAKKDSFSFETPISAIVGPNGSGKSNVAEAFRFVLGEQSIKSMRGKKGEDLIFNGTNKISRQNKAAVKITFDNKDRLLKIDFDQVILERVVHRDGQNEYYAGCLVWYHLIKPTYGEPFHGIQPLLPPAYREHGRIRGEYSH